MLPSYSVSTAFHQRAPPRMASASTAIAMPPATRLLRTPASLSDLPGPNKLSPAALRTMFTRPVTRNTPSTTRIAASGVSSASRPVATDATGTSTVPVPSPPSSTTSTLYAPRAMSHSAPSNVSDAFTRLMTSADGAPFDPARQYTGRINTRPSKPSGARTVTRAMPGTTSGGRTTTRMSKAPAFPVKNTSGEPMWADTSTPMPSTPRTRNAAPRTLCLDACPIISVSRASSTFRTTGPPNSRTRRSRLQSPAAPRKTARSPHTARSARSPRRARASSTRSSRR